MTSSTNYDYQQTSIFDFAYPAFKITKPIRLIELFAGYGSQKLAMEYLHANCESWRICEWSISSFEAYKLIHCQNDDTDYSKDMSKDDLARALFDKGVSADWETPLSLDSLERRPIDYLKKAYNAIKATKNIVDISKAKGSDFAMEDRQNYDVVMSYSFPCTDLSIAGRLAGWDEGSGTRSSLLWQVKRILSELHSINQLPNALVMENVPQVANSANKGNMAKWQAFLSSLGYRNYLEILNATDFGIPQVRKRAFMVSVKGDYSYSFPLKSKLKECLMDFLETNVPQSFYLTEKQKSAIDTSLMVGNGKEDPKTGVITCGIDRTTKNPRLRELANCITANEDRGMSCRGSNRTGVIEISPTIEQVGNIHKDIGSFKNRTDGRIYDPSHCCPTLGTMAGGNKQPFIVLGDSRFTEEQRAMFDENGNVKRYIGDNRTDNFKEGQIADISFPNGYNKGCRVHSQVPALNTATTMSSFVVKQDYRIRKLTPRECWRFMGVKDSDFDKVEGQFPNSVLYHLCGDSIVVPVIGGGVLSNGRRNRRLQAFLPRHQRQRGSEGLI